MLTPARFLDRWSPDHEQVTHLTRLADGLDHWRVWAEGQPVTVDAVQHTIATLEHRGVTMFQGTAVLAAPLRVWASEVDIDVPDVHVADHALRQREDVGIAL